jgi:hypothetical protein
MSSPRLGKCPHIPILESGSFSTMLSGAVHGRNLYSAFASQGKSRASSGPHLGLSVARSPDDGSADLGQLRLPRTPSGGRGARADAAIGFANRPYRRISKTVSKRLHTGEHGEPQPLHGFTIGKET